MTTRNPTRQTPEPARRRWLRQLGAWLLGGAAPAAGWSQPAAFPIPGKPIRIVIPAPPGGPADLIARTMARQLSLQLNQHPVIVDSKPGGASIPAAVEVARAAPDGHTLFLGLNTTHTQVPHLFSKLPYDPFRDFTPITQLYRAQSVLVAHPSLAANDLREAVAQSRREVLPFGSASAGTSGHLYIEMLNHSHGAKFNHVPYKGSADAMRDLLGGFIKLLFDSPTTALTHIRAGRLKALAVTGPQRMAELPEVRSAREQGYPELDTGTWLGVFGPGGLPAETLARLNQELVKALRSPEARAQFEPLGVELTGTSAADFAALVRSDYDSWGQIIRKIGLKLD